MQTHEWEELLHEAPEGHLPGKRAVAEVIRLRREVAAFRDRMTKSAERYRAMHERDSDLKLIPDAEYDRHIAYILTRILEGDTDE